MLKRVIVVDDDKEIQEIVTFVLTRNGFDVAVASNGRQLQDLLAGQKPDLIVLDVMMPGQDGYDLIREVRKLPPERGGNIPAAALTAYARAEDRRRTLDAGFSLHLSKPVDPSELVAIVASLTRR